MGASAAIPFARTLAEIARIPVPFPAEEVRPMAVQTVQGLIRSRVDPVAPVDCAGFSGLTDALGGVDIDNPVVFQSMLQAARGEWPPLCSEVWPPIGGHSFWARAEDRFSILTRGMRVRSEEGWLCGLGWLG